MGFSPKEYDWPPATTIKRLHHSLWGGCIMAVSPIDLMPSQIRMNYSYKYQFPHH
jgi:hypothetical protein